MTTTADRPAQEFKVVGTRPIRHDGVDKVLGRAQYGADLKLSGPHPRRGAPQPVRARHHQEGGTSRALKPLRACSPR